MEWLKQKLSIDPASAVHVWADNKIIGQMELGAYRNDPQVGYVHLYYLVPSARGRNASKQLDDYAVDYLRKRGFAKAVLIVTKTNTRAQKYFKKMGWQESGRSPDDPAALLFERVLSPK